MALIKEECEDVRIEEAFKIRDEDAEEQTGWFSSSDARSSAEITRVLIIKGFI